MKKTFVSIFFLLIIADAVGQNDPTDSVITGTVVINKDPRLDILAKKELEFNTFGLKSAKGYRLLVLSSNEREKAMKVRARLLQLYPEQKVYMVFQTPFIKLKFGNFVNKSDAEKYKDMITRARLVTNNIYIVGEAVEVKPDKNREKTEE